MVPVSMTNGSAAKGACSSLLPASEVWSSVECCMLSSVVCQNVARSLSKLSKFKQIVRLEVLGPMNESISVSLQQLIGFAG